MPGFLGVTKHSNHIIDKDNKEDGGFIVKNIYILKQCCQRKDLNIRDSRI